MVFVYNHWLTFFAAYSILCAELCALEDDHTYLQNQKRRPLRAQEEGMFVGSRKSPTRKHPLYKSLRMQDDTPTQKTRKKKKRIVLVDNVYAQNVGKKENKTKEKTVLERKKNTLDFTLERDANNIGVMSPGKSILDLVVTSGGQKGVR